MVPVLLGPCWALFLICSHFFRIFELFFGLLKSSWLFLSIFVRFFSILEGFWKGLGRILEGFFADFFIFLENADFVKYSVFPKENQ